MYLSSPSAPVGGATDVPGRTAHGGAVQPGPVQTGGLVDARPSSGVGAAGAVLVSGKGTSFGPGPPVRRHGRRLRTTGGGRGRWPPDLTIARRASRAPGDRVRSGRRRGWLPSRR